jgi:prolyl oligopeptidase
MPWYDHGGVYAVAHVRGGGENGKAWHDAGKGVTKANTWKDGIACAEYLVKAGYTKPDRLAIWGTSAGGIFAGRAITERPELFAAALLSVPSVDTLRTEFGQNPLNTEDYGTVKEEASFRGLVSMSAYANVKDGVKYPAVLVTGGVQDPRVDVWMPAKFAARMQVATASGKPVLFRVEDDAGHGMGATTTQVYAERADYFAFLFWQFGLPGFQPKSN